MWIPRMLLIFLILILDRAASATCRFPGAPAHSRTQFSREDLHEGTVVTYQCESGFELLGPSRRVCGADSRWTPDGIPFCVLNVAAGKAPMQISTLETGLPQRALDGSTASGFRAETCTLTGKEMHPWWYVNLLEPYMVQLVRLDFGISCCGPSPAVLVVRVGNNRPDLGTNPVCNRFMGYIEEGQPLFLPCNPPMPGAFVSVHLEAPGPSQLSICETFVYTDQALPIERCPQFRDQPPGSTATYNGKCYIFYDQQPAGFKQAHEFCHKRGGTLVDESNPALQGFISWELWRRHRSDSSSQYWLGAVRDAEDPSNWKWVNGNDVTVSFWNAADGIEGCARFDGTKGWLWADTDCQANLNYICQHQPTTCGRPEQPPNSTMVAEGFDVGSSVKYTCDPGHLLVGPTVRTCLETGFYNEFPPVCKQIVCGFPAPIDNGRYLLLNESVTYLSHVQYACEAGFEMEGRARLICDIDGRWNGPPPKCNAEKRVSTTASPPTTPRQLPTLTISPSTTPSPPVTTTRFTPTRIRSSTRPVSSATPFLSSEAPRRMRPKTTTTEPPTTTIRHHDRTPAKPHERVTTKVYERPSTKYYERPPERKTTVGHVLESPTSHVPHIIVADHKNSQIVENAVDIHGGRHNPRVTLPFPADGERHHDPTGARFNVGAVVALGVFGALVFAIAIITTAVVLFRRKRHRGQRYKHHPDCNTVASVDSSSSESRSGLNRFYQQAWEELHEAAGAKHQRRHQEAPKDGAELVVSDAYALQQRDKRRHHHHHYHRDARHPDWHSQHRPHHNHKRY